MYLGLRVPKGKHQPQKHAWLLSQTSSPQLECSRREKCLLDVGAKDLEVSRPGLFFAGTQALLSSRARSKVTRKVGTVEVLKGPSQTFNEPKAARVFALGS